MGKISRYKTVWPFQLLLLGFTVWLAQAILAQGQVDRKPVVIERPPLRFIKDPNPSFSAVAVDSDSNMLVGETIPCGRFRAMTHTLRTRTELHWILKTSSSS